MTRIDHSILHQRVIPIVLCVFMWLLWIPLPASAEKRVALVVGNADYKSVAPLDNPGNDAADMAAKLRGLGFNVIEGTDADLPQLKNYIKQFSQQLNGADVALFYYSGHAIQVQDTNYLVPVDATLGSELDVDLETLSLGTVLRQMQNKARVNLVFLDACRDNPFLQRLKRGTKNIQATRGLSRVDTNHVGSVIVFATAPGETALDGTGRRNSPFTEAMLRHMDTPGQDIGIMLRKVRGDVIRTTNSEQIPWERSSLTDAFYFSSLAAPPAGTLQPDNPPPARVPQTGFFNVTGLPAGARFCVYVESEWRCNSNQPLPLGQEYPLFASASGYQDWSGSAYLDADNQVVRVSLVAEAVQEQRASYEPDMVFVKGGCYQMGSPEDEFGRHIGSYDQEMQHRVCVDDIRVAKTETTVSQFRAFVEATDYRTEAEFDGEDGGCLALQQHGLQYHPGSSWRNPGFEQGNDEPVVCVSWNDALVYTNWLSEQTAKQYRLPTEAEWEYAARGGSAEARFWGDGGEWIDEVSQACKYGNVGNKKRTDEPLDIDFRYEHSCDDGVPLTARVESYMANSYGLFDMMGNVWEWTCSHWSETYKGAEQRCITGKRGRRSQRGGSYSDGPLVVRSAQRLGALSSRYRSNTTGFRIVLNPN